MQLLEINGNSISTFIDLERILDDCVGQQITLLIARAGKELTVSTEVCLHVYINVFACMYVCMYVCM